MAPAASLPRFALLAYSVAIRPPDQPKNGLQFALGRPVSGRPGSGLTRQICLADATNSVPGAPLVHGAGGAGLERRLG